MVLEEAIVTISLEAVSMTIRYGDGRSLEALILSRTEKTMRVAVKGGDDSMVLTCVDGTWVSEDCCPVQVEFEWQQHHREKTPVSEGDCICPKELAARLIQVLLSGDEDEFGSDEALEQRPSGQKFHPLIAGAGYAALQSVN
jgi:uncharacterized Fe-S cluster-containing radical SAM superfamily protein